MGGESRLSRLLFGVHAPGFAVDVMGGFVRV